MAATACVFAYEVIFDGVRTCVLPAVAGFVLNSVGYLAVPSHYQPTTLLYVFGGILLLISVCMRWMYGDGSFNQATPTGPYEVAVLEIHLPDSGNPISVFYPMDKHHKTERSKRKWIPYVHQERVLR